MRAPRVVVYEGTSKQVTRLHHLERKGYAVGFEGLIEFIDGLAPQNSDSGLLPTLCSSWVVNAHMTNRSLRERFGLPETNSTNSTVSQIIASTVEEGLIKPVDNTITAFSA